MCVPIKLRKNRQWTELSLLTDLDYHNEILTGSFSSSMIDMGGEARKRQGSFIWTDCLTSRLPRGRGLRNSHWI